MARNRGTRTSGGSWDDQTIEAVWQKGTPEGKYAELHVDQCGAFMQRSKYGIIDLFGWEIDHIKPVAKGGTDDLSNLQPLQWENNRAKGDEYPDWLQTCKVRSR